MNEPTCDRFDDFVSLVVVAVASLERNLVGSTAWSFEPRLQESGQIFHHVFLKSFAGSSYLKEERKKTPRVLLLLS